MVLRILIGILTILGVCYLQVMIVMSIALEEAHFRLFDLWMFCVYLKKKPYKNCKDMSKELFVVHASLLF